MQPQKVYGVQETIRLLQTFEADAIKQVRKDIRSAVEPMKKSIDSYIPNEAPLRGMRHQGRTAWRGAAYKVTTRTAFGRKSERGKSAIVSIWAGPRSGKEGSAAFQMGDLAGKQGRTSSGRSRGYRGRPNGHRLNGQGSDFLSYLRGRWGAPSRFVWKGASRHIPDVTASVMLSLEKASAIVNRKLVKK